MDTLLWMKPRNYAYYWWCFHVWNLELLCHLYSVNVKLYKLFGSLCVDPPDAPMFSNKHSTDFRGIFNIHWWISLTNSSSTTLGFPFHCLSSTGPVPWKRHTGWYSTKILRYLLPYRHTPLMRVQLEVYFKQSNSMALYYTHSQLTGLHLTFPRLVLPPTHASETFCRFANTLWCKAWQQNRYISQMAKFQLLSTGTFWIHWDPRLINQVGLPDHGYM